MGLGPGMTSGDINDWCPVPSNPRVTDLALTRHYLEKALEYLGKVNAPARLQAYEIAALDWVTGQEIKAGAMDGGGCRDHN